MLEPSCAEVRADHGEVNVLQSAERFELDDDELADQQIETMQTDVGSAVEDWHRNFALEVEPAATKLDAQRVRVNGFDESGTKTPVNIDRSTDDRVGQILMRKRHPSIDTR